MGIGRFSRGCVSIRLLAIILLAVAMTTGGVGVASGAELRPGLLALGTVVNDAGVPVSDAVVVGLAVSDSDSGAVSWTPIAKDVTNPQGRFQLTVRPNVALGVASIGTQGTVEIAFVVEYGGGYSMYKTQFLAEEMQNGRWVLDQLEAEPIPELEIGEVDASDEGFVLGGEKGTHTGGNRALGAAQSGSGVRLELTISGSGDGIDASDGEPFVDGQPSMLSAAAVPSDVCESFRSHAWQTFTWLWKPVGAVERGWTASAFVRTRSSTAVVSMTNARNTSASILLTLGNSVIGSMGYERVSSTDWGFSQPIGRWGRYFSRIEVEFQPMVLYCQETAYITHPTSYTYWKPVRPTGGFQTYPSTLDFKCSKSPTQHSAGSTLWVSKSETIYYSGGMRFKGVNATSKQITTSIHRIDYKGPSKVWYMCGNNDHAVYATLARETEASGAS